MPEMPTRGSMRVERARLALSGHLTEVIEEYDLTSSEAAWILAKLTETKLEQTTRTTRRKDRSWIPFP